MEKQMVRKTEKKNGGTEKEQRQRKGSREKEGQKDKRTEGKKYREIVG